ncbi:hypothetical protein GGR34_000776 [Microvirga flocculans]|uniref:Uncharacterized protein n=1 Tax=Microvirga flocculans TaxID=217168 RepID=A0A7W6ICX4_9HYPH|nr:hypothetical protein [Microvirga flocculans]MBB4039141.1 hypothetical protein [Microvirga flocculans]
MTFDRLLAFAISRIKAGLPLSLDMEVELVERGYDIEALKNAHEDDFNLGFAFADEDA